MITLVLLLAAYFGMLCHWYKKVYREQTSCSLREYLKTYPRYTLGAIVSVTGSVIATVATGIELSEQSVALAFSTGFMLDSAFNKMPEES